MHIKRFEAESLEAALEQVRATLGPNALILSSRTIARGRGAFGLFARSAVEVQAGVEPTREIARAIDPAPSLALDSPPAAPVNPNAAGPLESVVDSLRQELAALRRRTRLDDELRVELGEIRRSFAAWQRSARPPHSELEADDEKRCSLLENRGLEARHAQRLVARWRTGQGAGQPGSLKDCLRSSLEDRLAVPRPDARKPIRILVGPPGVGKTTTLAKLAARNEEGERDVAFVAFDSVRIDARDPLRAFAVLVDAPYAELTRAEDLAAFAARHPHHAILVDTAGRSPGDLGEQASLALLRAKLGDRASIELVVDATIRAEVARRQRARFDPVGLDRLILTRVDECESRIAVVNRLLDDDWPPLCWLGTGQRVPEDLELADPEALVASVFEPVE